MGKAKKEVKVSIMSKDEANKLWAELANKARDVLTKQKLIPYTLVFKFVVNKEEISLSPVDTEIINTVRALDEGRMFSSQKLIFDGRPAFFSIKEYLDSKKGKDGSGIKLDLSSFTKAPERFKEEALMRLTEDLNWEFSHKLSFKVRAEVGNFAGVDFMDLFFGKEYFPVSLLSQSGTEFISDPSLSNASSIFFFYSDKNKEKLFALSKKMMAIREYLKLLDEVDKINNARQEKALEIEAIKT